MPVSLDYLTLHGFSDLTQVRDLLARADDGLIVTNLPCEPVSESLLYSLSGTNFIIGDEGASAAGSTVLTSLAGVLHGAAQKVLDHISHGLELPWEKYLSEMHELEPSASHEILLAPFKEDKIPSKWSTMTVLVDPQHPDTALISFGAALSVFSAGITPKPSGGCCSPDALWAFRETQGIPRGDAYMMALYIRPSGNALYTRTAGALMKPLSEEEHNSAVRVRDIDFGTWAYKI